MSFGQAFKGALMSLDIQRDVDLSSMNTLGLKSQATRFAQINSASQIPLLIEYAQSQPDVSPKPLQILWLGGGSNLVLGPVITGIVAKLAITGIERVEQIRDKVLIEVGAGESWHEFVRWSIDQGCYGLENLALIPGTVGAAPVQNIGAYGVELASSVESVAVYDALNQCFARLTADECKFGYRDSVFKQQAGRYVITHVVFRLSRDFSPILKYAPLADRFTTPDFVTAQQVFDAVCEIRNSKLPDPNILANVGSFFKNPLVNESLYQQLVSIYPNIPAYPAPQGHKLAAGWLIESCGLKGYVEGPVGVHKQQALVLVNYGGATRTDIEHLATRVRNRVRDSFGVELEQEPIAYPQDDSSGC